MTTGAGRRSMIVVLAATVALAGCFGGDDDDTGSTSVTTDVPTTTGPSEPIVTIEGSPVGTTTAQLGVRLSEGQTPTAVEDRPDVALGTPLSDEDVAAVLSGLPEWNVPPTDQVEFRLPAVSLEPPTVGTTIEQQFPPASEPPTDPADIPADGPLTVVRHQPEGEVELAPFIALTFDEPMIAIATVDQLDEADVPVTISPAVDGRWRWLGTQTLRFELVPGELDRLPAATEFTVTVPAGTTSVNGAVLDEDFSWTFTTPTPTVRTIAGLSNSMPTDAVTAVVFDQRVDPDAALDHIHVRAGAGANDTVLRSATEEEIADAGLSQLVDDSLDGRVVAFRPVGEYPVDTRIVVTVGPDMPSAEGPLTSSDTTVEEGRTFGALEIVDHQCGWGDGCEPGMPFEIVFSNPLDLDQVTAADITDMIGVEPAIPGLRIDVSGDRITLSGATTGRTTYAVTLRGELVDVFGQRLQADTTVEFEVGPARPMLQGLQSEFITTDPATDPSVSIVSINHEAVRVRAWAVTPANFAEFRDYVSQLWQDAGAEDPPWSLVMDDEVPIDGTPDQFVETFVDLTTAFDEAGSQIVVRIDPLLDIGPNDDDYWRNMPTVAWVQQTDLGVEAVVDNHRLILSTTDLLTGEPRPDVAIELVGDGRVVTTGDDGLAEVDLGAPTITALWAHSGDGTAFLPDTYWQIQERDDETIWYAFDDRGIYRPGETVHLKGFVRRFAWSEDARLALYDTDAKVDLVVRDAQGVDIADLQADLSALGGFDVEFPIPEDANLGAAWIELSLTGTPSFTGAQHSFQIQEFRRPEFEVTTSTTTPGPFVVTNPATVMVSADYFAGGPLPDAPVDWLVSTARTNYAPPGWDRFHFGVWQPWWYYGDLAGGSAEVAIGADACFDCEPTDTTTYEEFSGTTDAAGEHALQIDFDPADVDLPSIVTAQATVTDVNRQAWASTTDLLVHPASVYVGLRSDRNFVRQGEPLRVAGVVTNIDGEIVAGRSVEVVAGRLDWSYVNGEWTEVLTDEQTCEFTSTDTVDDDAMTCEFPTEVGGQYRVTATVAGQGSQRNRSEITQWVSGGGGRPQRTVEEQQVVLVPDQESYAPGDTAEVLVQAPFSPAWGTVTIARNGIESVERIDAPDGDAVIEVPVGDNAVPNLHLIVHMTGSAPRVADDGTPLESLPPQPAYASGNITLPVPPASRTLDVLAIPASAMLQPGDDTSVTVEVSDADGAPVQDAEVALVVVDEAVLSVIGYDLADPIDAFYRDLGADVSSRDLRSTILLAAQQQFDEANGSLDSAPTTVAAAGEDTTAESGVAADTADGGAAPRAPGLATGQIDLRTDFDPLAVFAPEETTDADGHVTVDVPLPDNLTRYRVMAVAASGRDRFGTGESTITARLPLMVRASAPRFLNFGDQVELPLVLQNQTDAAIDVDVVVQTANLALTGAQGQRVSVPANDRIEVRFPATTVSAGTARVRIAAVSGEFSDASEFSLPVYTPATTEAFATYGVVDDQPVEQPVATPTDVIEQYGGLEVGTSSTALQSLTDAVIYLRDYPYDSADGYASRIMAIAALRPVLDAFDAAGLPPAEEIDRGIDDDIAALAALQNDDGGFPYWQRGRESQPYVSVQATHALVVARDAGYAVPDSTLEQALTYTAEVENHLPPTWSEQSKAAVRAYAIHVLDLAGRTDSPKALALFDEAGDVLQVDGLAWIWPSITDPDARDEIARRITNAAVETAGAASFATDYTEGDYVIAQTSRRTDGIVLDALITQVPDSDLIPKVVNGLLGRQQRGHWDNVQENAFILLALDRYFRTFESVEPNFVARTWLGGTYVAETDYTGRTTVRADTVVPMSDVIDLTTPPAPPDGDTGTTDTGTSDTGTEPAPPSIVMAKDGEGRLYYRLGLVYAPADLSLDARDEGFVVERTYEPVGDGRVTQAADGTWQIEAGSTVRVRVTMVADGPRTNIALVDPLPAGLEPLNPDLSITPDVPPEDADTGDVVPVPRTYWWWRWFDHQNLRDDRAEAFATYLYGGTYEYTYLARATTPGTFITPPTRAEEIYAPEVFGRSASATVTIS